MGTFPSLTKLRADFDAADEALDAVQRQAREVREQLQKKLEELGDE